MRHVEIVVVVFESVKRMISAATDNMARVFKWLRNALIITTTASQETMIEIRIGWKRPFTSFSCLKDALVDKVSILSEGSADDTTGLSHPEACWHSKIPNIRQN